MSDNRKNRVFLSYASEDLLKVREVYEGLIERGLDVWFDKEHLKAGRWHPQIEEAIEQSRYFVICLSKSAVEKIGHTHPGYQKEELSFAYVKAREQPDSEFTIVPTRIMKLEERGRGGFQLSPFQQYDLFDNFDKGLDKLAVDMGGLSLSDSTAIDQRSEDKMLIDKLYAKALTEYYAGKYEESMRLLDSILVLSPEDAEAMFKKGTALSRLCRYEEALETYDKAIEIDPDYSDSVWTCKGSVFDRLGRYEDALVAYYIALKINPGNSFAWFNKGVTLNHLGRYKDALVANDSALKINPGNADAWFGRGVTLVSLNRYDEALFAYDKTLDVNPGYADAWYNKGTVLGILDRHEEALDAFNKALQINPNDASAWYSKGTFLGRLDRHEEALDAFNKALQVDPKDVLVLYNKGVALGELGCHEEAFEAFNKALELDPDFKLALEYKNELMKELKGKD